MIFEEIIIIDILLSYFIFTYRFLHKLIDILFNNVNQTLNWLFRYYFSDIYDQPNIALYNNYCFIVNQKYT